MDRIIGVDAIDQVQNIIHNSGNTIISSINRIKYGIEVLIINTFTDEILTELIPNNIIGDGEEISELAKFEIKSFIDLHIKSLSDNEILNIKWACKLNLLNPEAILIYEPIQFKS